MTEFQTVEQLQYTITKQNARITDFIATMDWQGDEIARLRKHVQTLNTIVAKYVKDEALLHNIEKGWIKHDGSEQNPVPDQEWVAVIQVPGTVIKADEKINWEKVSEYLVLF